MGRIKGVGVKVLGKELIEKFGDRFSEEFENNKKVLEEVKKIQSKRTRNIMAGYIAKEMKRIKKSGI
jgi:small subunit ribosomal protein S17e